MYSKDESRQLRKDFWIAFSNYTKFYSTKVGEPIEWVLYKTGIKGLELKFEVEKKHIGVMIEVNAASEDRRFEMYLALDKYRLILSEGFGQELEWVETYELAEKDVSRIFVQMGNIKYHNPDNWPEIFKFLAENMNKLQTNFKDIHDILLDEFAKPAF